MIPKIEFRYSWVYDQKWNNGTGSGAYPSSDDIANYIVEVKKVWVPVEEKILREISFITGLNWSDTSIKCYVVGRCRPFSDPLTISIYKKDVNQFIGVLMHELVHQILIQSGNKAESFFNIISVKYPTISYISKLHIFVHSVWAHLVEKFFSKELIEEDINWAQSYSDYKTAWDIVSKVGYNNILGEIRNSVELKTK